MEQPVHASVEISRRGSLNRSMVEEGYLCHGLLVRADGIGGGLAADALGVGACRHAVGESGYPADLVGPDPAHLRDLLECRRQQLALAGASPQRAQYPALLRPRTAGARRGP